MATLDDARHKLGGAGVGDFVLRLVADPPAQLNVLEDSLAIQRGEDFGIGLMIFMCHGPLLQSVHPVQTRHGAGLCKSLSWGALTGLVGVSAFPNTLGDTGGCF